MKLSRKKFKRNFMNFSLWFCLWTKRFFLKPFFLFTLLLIPITTFFIQKSKFSEASVLRIAICIDGEKPDSVSRNFVKELLNLSGKTVQFYKQDSPEKLYSKLFERKETFFHRSPEKRRNEQSDCK